MDDEFRKRLRMLRKKQGRGQVVVSELCGLHPCAVYRYETGRAKPDMDALIALADYFDVSIDYLVGRE